MDVNVQFHARSLYPWRIIPVPTEREDVGGGFPIAGEDGLVGVSIKVRSDVVLMSCICSWSLTQW